MLISPASLSKLGLSPDSFQEITDQIQCLQSQTSNEVVDLADQMQGLKLQTSNEVADLGKTASKIKLIQAELKLFLINAQNIKVDKSQLYHEARALNSETNNIYFPYTRSDESISDPMEKAEIEIKKWLSLQKMLFKITSSLAQSFEKNVNLNAKFIAMRNESSKRYNELRAIVNDKSFKAFSAEQSYKKECDLLKKQSVDLGNAINEVTHWILKEDDVHYPKEMGSTSFESNYTVRSERMLALISIGRANVNSMMSSAFSLREISANGLKEKDSKNLNSIDNSEKILNELQTRFDRLEKTYQTKFKHLDLKSTSKELRDPSFDPVLKLTVQEWALFIETCIQFNELQFSAIKFAKKVDQNSREVAVQENDEIKVQSEETSSVDVTALILKIQDFYKQLTPIFDLTGDGFSHAPGDCPWNNITIL